MDNPSTDDKFAVNRIKTGIAGLDEMLFGGLPEHSQTLVVGTPGSGKSLMTFQILYNNAKKGIPCTLILLDQKIDKFVKNALSAFPACKDIAELEKSRALNIYERFADDKLTTRESTMLFVSSILNAIQSDNSKVVVIDSISILRSVSVDDRAFTLIVNKLTESLDAMGVTGIVTIEASERVKGKISGLYEESMFDGIITVKNVVKESTAQHKINIMKFRYSNYSSAENLMEITPNGIVIKEA